jgi:hypothetical protein
MTMEPIRTDRLSIRESTSRENRIRIIPVRRSRPEEVALYEDKTTRQEVRRHRALARRGFL